MIEKLNLSMCSDWDCVIALLAFIDFDDYRDAEDAVRKMDGVLICSACSSLFCVLTAKWP